MAYEGMLAETVTISGDDGFPVSAYVARPLGPGPFPGVVLIHHLPGWDEWYREATRKFAYHGYAALSPNLYYRAGHGTPEDVAAKVRANGGVPDDQAVGDMGGALNYLLAQPYSNGKVGIFGTCSGGRHAFGGEALDDGIARHIVADDPEEPCPPTEAGHRHGRIGSDAATHHRPLRCSILAGLLRVPVDSEDTIEHRDSHARNVSHLRAPRARPLPPIGSHGCWIRWSLPQREA